MKQVSELDYLGCLSYETDTDDAECRWKGVSGKKGSGAIRTLANGRDLQYECATMFHEELVVLVLMYGNDTMKWKEKLRSRIKIVQMDKLKVFWILEG